MESTFAPTLGELVQVLNNQILRGVLWQFRLRDRLFEWSGPKCAMPKWDATSVYQFVPGSAQISPHPHLKQVQFLATHLDSATQWWISATDLLDDLTELYPKPGRSRIEIPVPDPPERAEADLRADAFAELCYHIPRRQESDLILTLDGRLRNAKALVRFGISPSTIIIPEMKPEVAIYQKLVILDTPLEGIQVLYTPHGFQHFLQKSNISQRIVAFNVDFCGSIQPGTLKSLQSLPHLQVYAVTRSKSRTHAAGEEDWPVLSGATREYVFNQQPTESRFYTIGGRPFVSSESFSDDMTVSNHRVRPEASPKSMKHWEFLVEHEWISFDTLRAQAPNAIDFYFRSRRARSLRKAKKAMDWTDEDLEIIQIIA